MKFISLATYLSLQLVILIPLLALLDEFSAINLSYFFPLSLFSLISCAIYYYLASKHRIIFAEIALFLISGAGLLCEVFLGYFKENTYSLLFVFLTMLALYFTQNTPKHWVFNFKEELSELFQISLAIYLLDLLLSTIDETYKAIPYLIYFVVGLGILSVFFEPKTSQQQIYTEPAYKNYILIALLTIASTYLLYTQTKELEKLSYIITGLGATLVALSSYLILFDNEEQTKEEEKRTPFSTKKWQL